MILEVLVVWLSHLILLAFAVICLASGLYYIAEFVEEYTVWTKKVLRITILSVIGLHCLLLFTELPSSYLLIGILAHVCYYLLMKDFPFMQMLSLTFLLGCALLMLDHFVWFYYFSRHWHEFNQTLSFFVTCVWLVPFIFIVSISANESTLPYGIISSSGEEVSADDFGPVRKRGKRTSSFMVLLNFLKRKKESILPASGSQKLF
eukprot:TRINITY_DN7468_c0_g1_i1.p1 TRINITY_DN7468_c0_g1~~TRINITY_DN7468_c0_g1_i1.p1  ORF type:complete len:205 (-),score=45.73 TRINITY_DN7468_c0_g1_i1:71-685(-)